MWVPSCGGGGCSFGCCYVCYSSMNVALLIVFATDSEPRITLIFVMGWDAPPFVRPRPHPSPLPPSGRGDVWWLFGRFALEKEGFEMTLRNVELKYPELTGRVIGCAMAVHSALGNGFQEVVYQRALGVEMELAGLSFAREFEMPIWYRDVQVGTRRVDFLVEERIVVELKAVSGLDDSHLAQGINYLEAFGLEVGLLLNFGGTKLEFRRVVNGLNRGLR